MSSPTLSMSWSLDGLLGCLRSAAAMCGISTLLLACGGSDEELGGSQPPPSPAVILYVSTLGDDGAPGTADRPLRSIQKAVELAVSKADVRVAEGTYQEAIRLRQDVSIYGGYKANAWETRDPRAYPTRISGGLLGIATVSCPGSVTSTTRIDGLTIHGTTWISSSTAVQVGEGAAPQITNNVILGGSGMNGVGIQLAGSSASVINNVVSIGLSSAAGLVLTGISADKILNNTVIVSAFTTGYGIRIDSGEMTRLEVSNNIVKVAAGSATYGILNNGQGQPTVRNNDVLAVGDQGTNYVGLDGNIAIEPELSEFRLTPSSPSAVKTGGRTLADLATYPRNADGMPSDIDGRPRTEPWSIGASEEDR